MRGRATPSGPRGSILGPAGQSRSWLLPGGDGERINPAVAEELGRGRCPSAELLNGEQVLHWGILAGRGLGDFGVNRAQAILPQNFFRFFGEEEVDEGL